MAYYDAHTHLNADGLYEQWEDYYQQFLDAGGKQLITVGINPEYNLRAIELAQKTAKTDNPIYSTIGIHPYEVGHGTILSKKDVDDQIDTLIEQIAQHKELIVAVGEGGIDAHYPEYTTRKPLQQYAFEQQCELARKYNLPIVIHSRDQFEDTFAIIKNYPDCAVYFHCRGYGPEQLTILVEHLPRLWVGFCGNVTYPKATQIQASLKHARTLQQQGRCKILFETDAPYLTPQQRRGQKNHPALVEGIYSYAAEYLSLSPNDLENSIEENLLGLFFVGIT